MKRLRNVTLAAGTVTMLLSGCAGMQIPGSSAAPGDSPARQAPTTSAEPARDVAPAKRVGTTSSRQGHKPAPCRARQLSGENRGSDGAAGSLGLTVALRNTGSTSCTLTGEPTVVLLRNGTALPTHAERDSSEPPATLTVRPNRTVTFIIIWTNPGMEADPSTCQPESTHIRLTPPNQDGTLTIPAVITTCHGNLRLTPPAP